MNHKLAYVSIVVYTGGIGGEGIRVCSVPLLRSHGLLNGIHQRAPRDKLARGHFLILV